MIPLNYHHLYYFHTIAKAGSIAKAGEKLLLSQPALSLQLKQLEKALGRTLFERDKRRLVITEDGRRVLDYAESIFELGQELQDALRDRPSADRLAIQIGILSGMPRAFGHALLDRALASPEIHVQMTEGTQDALLSDLREHRLDLVLTDVSPPGREREEMSTRLLGRVPVVFAGTPALARRHGRLPKALDGAPLILPSRPSRVYHELLDLLSRWNVRPRVIAEVQDVELARRLAVGGRGLVALNATTLSVSAPAGALRALAGAPTGLYESVYLVSRRRRWPNPAAEKIMKEFQLPGKVTGGGQ